MKIKVQTSYPIFEGASTDCFFEILRIKNQWQYHLYPKYTTLPKGLQVRLRDGQVKKEGDRVPVHKNEGIVYTYDNYVQYEEVLGKILVDNDLLSDKVKQKYLKEFNKLSNG